MAAQSITFATFRTVEQEGAGPGQPVTLDNDPVTFTFRLDSIVSPDGVLFYMIDTRDGDRTYRVTVNSEFASQIALVPGEHFFATLNNRVANLKEDNTLVFEPAGGSAPVDILNIVVLYSRTVNVG
jgi:hypothetical protein